MNFFKTFLACVLAFFVGSFISSFMWFFMVIVMALSMDTNTVSVRDGSILKIDLSEQIVDSPESDPLADFDFLSMQSTRKLPLMKALRAIEAGTYTPESAAALKERLRTVFNRGFWEGYYAGRPVAEHSAHYGSAATRRKVYVGKVTNFFKKLSVAEVLVEAAPLRRGEEIFFMGPTTGVAEQQLDELHGPDGSPVDGVSQGELCAIRTPGLVRRGDQLYKFEATV